MAPVKLYDTTLRDGAQGEGISFSLEDKIRIAQKLNTLGIHYIEGGYPGSNPKDAGFFRKIRNIPLSHAKITAFGSTRRAKNSVENDPGIRALLEAKTQVVAIFGKSWDLHVQNVLHTKLGENLNMIRDSVRYLKSKGLEVIYDAEHFFDGFLADAEYALRTLEAAQEAGADTIVLCDTNGGVMPSRLAEIIRVVQKRIDSPLGIHTHNDSGVAVANTIMAVELGIVHVQGTINGYGERCGNADLCVIIPNLKLKLGIDCLSEKQLQSITEVSRYVSELANLIPSGNQPYVGNSAFAHKGGMHISAVRKMPRTFEHIEPELVGNARRILISELSGVGTILHKAEEYGIDLPKDTPMSKMILAKLKELEHEGYQFEGAEGSFELLIKKAMGRHKTFFDLEGFRVMVEKKGKERPLSEATIKVKVGGLEEHTAAEGDGPVNALDNALRKALEEFYPTLKKMKLTDFKVRVLDAKAGTAAKVRVLIESGDHKDSWGTVGVSENIIEASWQALVDSIEYKLLKDEAEVKE